MRARQGQRCKAPAITGSTYCYFHAPELADKRKAARSKGGQRAKPVTVPKAEAVNIRQVAEVTAFLSQTITQTLRGEIDHRIGNCLGYLASVLLRSLQAGDLEERIRALEQAAGQGRAGA